MARAAAAAGGGMAGAATAAAGRGSRGRRSGGFLLLRVRGEAGVLPEASGGVLGRDKVLQRSPRPRWRRRPLKLTTGCKGGRAHMTKYVPLTGALRPPLTPRLSCPHVSRCRTACLGAAPHVFCLPAGSTSTFSGTWSTVVGWLSLVTMVGAARPPACAHTADKAGVNRRCGVRRGLE